MSLLLRLLRGCSKGGGGGGAPPPDLNLQVDSSDDKSSKHKQDLVAAAQDADADADAAAAAADADHSQPATPHLHAPAAASDDRSSTGGAYGALAQTYASSSSGGGGNNQSLAGALPPALRVAAAEPIPSSELLSSSSNLWPRLRAAYSIADLSSSASSSSGGGGSTAANNPPQHRPRRNRAVDVNSGGAVFVLVFAPPPAASTTTTTAGSTAPQPPQNSNKKEQLAVLKLPASGGRLAAQAEALASELAAAMGVPTPACRLLRRPSEEWSMALAAADALMAMSSTRRSRRPSWASWSLGGGSGVATSSSSSSTPTSIPSLSAELRAPSCPPAALLLEFCPGTPLGRCGPALVAASLSASPFSSSLAHDAGAVLALDLLLDNADRFPLRKELGWRGNLGNALVLIPPPSRLVAIDASVPRGRQLTSSSSSLSSSSESQKAERVAQLVAADGRFAAKVLRTALAMPCLGKKEEDDDDNDNNAATTTSSFQQGLRSALQRADSLIGLLETVETALRSSLAAFADEASPLMPPPVSPSPSPRSPAVSPRGRAGGAGRPVAPWAAAASTQTLSIPDLQDLTTAATSKASPAPLRPRPLPPPAPPPPPLLAASALAAITKAATTTTGPLNVLVTAWQDRLRRELEALAGAARDWQGRRRGGGGGSSSSSLLLLLGSYLGPYSSSSSSSPPQNPIADAHDLAARLGPLLRRARLLVSAAAEARAPDRVLPPLDVTPTTTTTATPCLYLGDAVSADCAHVLRRLGVRRVLCCAEELAWPPLPVMGFKAAARLGLVDGAGGVAFAAARRRDGGGAVQAQDQALVLLEQFDRAIKWIDGALEAAAEKEEQDDGGSSDDDEGGTTHTAPTSGVLVHCAEGRSRSAAVVAAYLIARKGMSAEEALEAVRKARPCASPKPLFVAALEAYAEAMRRKKGE